MTCDGMIRAEIWADINANTSNGREGTKWMGKPVMSAGKRM